MSPRDLLVAEEFLAPQGEGRNTGRLSYWVRCGGCDLRCSWCDTPYTWAFTDRQAAHHEAHQVYDPKAQLHRAPLADIAERVVVSTAGLVTFTGGEPLLQQSLIVKLMKLLPGYRFDFETAGNIEPVHLVRSKRTQFTVSPKLAGSGNTVDRRRNDKAIAMFLDLDAVFKFVVDTREHMAAVADLAEVSLLVERWNIPDHLVWLSPCGTTTVQVIPGMKELEKICIATGWNLSSRLQVLMHGSERGH